MRNYLAISLLFFAVLFPTLAQDENELTFGEIVTGEITNQEYEVEYTFEGLAGNVLAAFMGPTEGSDFNEPEILLLDSEFNVISDTSSVISFGGISLISELPADGQYTIIATRKDGRAGDSTGEFYLNVFIPRTIEYGTTYERESTNGQQIYSTFRTTTESMLEFEIASGDFRPQITISIINDSNTNLTPVMTASGITKGSLGVLEPDTLYVMVVAPAPFSYSFEELTATYTFDLVPLETE